MIHKDILFVSIEYFPMEFLYKFTQILLIILIHKEFTMPIIYFNIVRIHKYMHTNTHTDTYMCV